MVNLPNRLKEVREAVLRGEPVDYGRVAFVQALDLVIAGREFVEEAAARDEAENEWIRKQWGNSATPII